MSRRGFPGFFRWILALHAEHVQIQGRCVSDGLVLVGTFSSIICNAVGIQALQLWPPTHQPAWSGNCPHKVAITKRLKSWVKTFGMMGCGCCGLGLFRGLQITCQLTALGTWTSIEGITSVIPSTCTGHSWHSYRLLFGRFTQSQGTSSVGPATIAARAWPAFSMLPSAWHMNCSYSYSIEAPKRNTLAAVMSTPNQSNLPDQFRGTGVPPISTWSTWIFATTQGVTLAADIKYQGDQFVFQIHGTLGPPSWKLR